MSRRARARRLAVVIAAALSVSGCAGAAGYVAATPQLRVAVAGPCPATLGHSADVENPQDGLSRHLVPAGRVPLSGLICEYAANSAAGSPIVPDLARSIALPAANAARLAEALADVSLKHPSGTFGCPAESFGTITIIVLSYSQPTGDIDLWYKTSGCKTVDNGHASAFEGANPSFYNGFEAAFTQLTAK